MSPILTVLLRDLSDLFRFIFAVLMLIGIFSTITGWNLSNLEFDLNTLLSSSLHFLGDMVGLNSLFGSTFRSSNSGASTWSTSADEHDRQQHFEEGGEYVYGLVNTGNSCFLNSVLQALSALDSLPAYLLSLQQQSMQLDTSQSQQQQSSQAPLAIPVINALSKTVRQLKTPLNRRSSFRPTRLVTALSSNNRIINREQQDAQELFQIVSSSLDDEERKIERMIKESRVESLFDVGLLRKLARERDYKFCGDATNNSALRGSVIERGVGRNPESVRTSHGPKNPFTGLLASRLSCGQCGYTEAIRHFTFDNISLPLPSSYTCTLDQCFSLFTSLERLQDVVCRKCSLQATYKSIYDQIIKLQSMSTCDTEKIATLQSKQALVVSALKEDIERDLGPDIPLKKHISRISTKQVMLAKPPQILTLHLSRSTVHSSGAVFKNGSQVIFDEYLDVTPFVTGGTLVTQPDIGMSRPDFGDLPNDFNTKEEKYPRKRYLYKLKSIVVHFGSHSFGHFVAYRRRARRQCECMDCQAKMGDLDKSTAKIKSERHAHREDEWYRISDEKVDPCRLVDVLRANPYMLLYERLNDTEIEQRERELRSFVERTNVRFVHTKANNEEHQESTDLGGKLPRKEKDAALEALMVANLLLMGDIGARAKDDIKEIPIQESSQLKPLQPSEIVSPPLDESSDRISKPAERSDAPTIPPKSKKSKRRKNKSSNNLTTSSSSKSDISVPSSPSTSLSISLSSSDQPNQSSVVDHSSMLPPWPDHAESRSRRVGTGGGYLHRQIKREGASPTSGGAVVVAVN